MRFFPLLTVCISLTPLCLAACGDKFATADADGAADSGTDSGTDTSSDDDDLGTPPDNCGHEITATCEVNEDCLVAANLCDPCFSESCSGPIAASKHDVLTQGCLRTWARRDQGLDDSCEVPTGIACPASCAVPPACPAAKCVDGACYVYDDTTCSGTGGAPGTGGSDTGVGGSSTGTGGAVNTGGTTGTGGLKATGGMISATGGGITEL